MIPSILATQFREGLIDYMEASFPVTSPLFGRSVRLEIRFKRKKHEYQAWDPNLLSCTPTLEMGIDIGDLSTVVLCSIPPAQAQYMRASGGPIAWTGTP